MNASEFVHPDVQRRFQQKYEGCGLRPEALVAGYGLAENALCVTTKGRRALSRRNANGQVQLASCGRPVSGVSIRIVEPDSTEPLPDGTIGEVVVDGASVCGGYWNDPVLTEQTFGNGLRTGDLGFIDDGELFICGRSKDVVVIAGSNLYPDDLEAAVHRLLPELANNGVVALPSHDIQDGSFVLIIETRAAPSAESSERLSNGFYTETHRVPERIVFVARGSIARTTSGKTARGETGRLWRANLLTTLAVFRPQAAGSVEIGDAQGRARQLLEWHVKNGRGDCTPGEAGLDSVAIAALIQEVQRLAPLRRSDAQVVLDDGLFWRMTVREIAEALASLEGGDDAIVSDVSLLIRTSTEARRRNEQDAMRQDASWRLAIPPPDIAKARCGTNTILLTGATGFVGPFLLESLLRRTDSTLVLVVRAASEAAGYDRVLNALASSMLLSEEIRAHAESRLRVVCGDIGHPKMGLSSGKWESLARSVDVIVHNAAAVSYVRPYNELRRVNIDGTKAALELAGEFRVKRLHHISSTTIFGWTPRHTASEDESNGEMAALDFGYAQTKWVAEQLVLAARTSGLPVWVHRSSFLSASTSGIASGDDIIVRLLAFMITHRLSVDARNQISFLPVDVAADSMAALIKACQTPETFNVTVDDYYTMGDITDEIEMQFGYKFRMVGLEAFVAIMERECTSREPIFPLLNFLKRSRPHLTAMEKKRYDNHNYRRARRDAGWTTSLPSVAQTARALVTAMRRLEFI
jgi:thioester reductase-like protein